MANRIVAVAFLTASFYNGPELEAHGIESSDVSTSESARRVFRRPGQRSARWRRLFSWTCFRAPDSLALEFRRVRRTTTTRRPVFRLVSTSNGNIDPATGAPDRSASSRILTGFSQHRMNDLLQPALIRPPVSCTTRAEILARGRLCPRPLPGSPSNGRVRRLHITCKRPQRIVNRTPASGTPCALVAFPIRSSRSPKITSHSTTICWFACHIRIAVLTVKSSATASLAFWRSL